MKVKNYQNLDLYRSTDGMIFEVLNTYNPNEENDPWVTFQNYETKQEYTCRKEAFLARYTKTP